MSPNVRRGACNGLWKQQWRNIREAEMELDSWLWMHSAVRPQSTARQPKALPSAHREGRRPITQRNRRLQCKDQQDVLDPLPKAWGALAVPFSCSADWRPITSRDMLGLGQAAWSACCVTTSKAAWSAHITPSTAWKRWQVRVVGDSSGRSRGTPVLTWHTL